MFIHKLPGDCVGSEDEGHDGEEVRAHDDEEDEHVHKADARYGLRLWWR